MSNAKVNSKLSKQYPRGSSPAMANTLTFQNSGLRAFNQTQQNFSQLVSHDFNNDYRYPDQINNPDVEKNSITIGGDMIQGHHVQNNSSNPAQGYDMFDPK